jgi:2-polyprenyl-3-methyl-5-hydroxy-6-metoxy-1,4-benzoquinol methylase
MTTTEVPEDGRTIGMQEPELRYGFGGNWKSFVAHALNDQRVASAVASLRKLLGTDSLTGRRVLDIGCGSGLFSLAACLLEAAEVQSFDLDPDSVAAAESLRAAHGIPGERWRIGPGSVLDEGFMAALEPADVVYSWGVLHHTGQMWRAIDLAASRVRPGGLFAIAIYNKVRRIPDRSTMWWRIKRAYVGGGPATRFVMEAVYVANHMLTRLVTLRNPFRSLRDRGGGGRRGMEFMHDVRDWLGGFPYEFATAGEVFHHVHDTLGFELVALNAVEGNACNEFVFRRP